MVLLAKVIKKEVFDLSDTMDVLAQVVNRVNKKLVNIEKALEN